MVAVFEVVDPIGSGSEHGSFTIYCAIQVCLEGKIPDMPIEEDTNFGYSIARNFGYYPQLISKSIVGARVVHVFTMLNASEEKYDLASLDVMTRFYNGEELMNATHEVPFMNLQKKWARMHYIGVYIGTEIDDLSHWEDLDFFVFFIGKIGEFGFEGTPTCAMIKLLRDYNIDISSKHEDCAVDVLAKNFREIYTRLLSIDLRDIDFSFALRILKGYSMLIRQEQELPVQIPWKELDEKIVDAFVKFPHLFKHVVHLIPDLASVYFLGKLPIDLTSDEEAILLVKGLQKCPLNETEVRLERSQDDIKASFSKIFGKAIDFYNTLSPEVVDPFPERKKRKTSVAKQHYKIQGSSGSKRCISKDD
ncbi:hypothetical protein Ancab_029695 [Ancistrocladus abbreviatus]